MSSLNLAGLAELEYLYCYDNPNMFALSLTGCSSLKVLDAHSSRVKSINVNGLPVQQIHAYNCTNLTGLQAQDCELVLLDLHGDTSLNSIYCDNNDLQTINFAGCSAVKLFRCGGNRLTSLDLTQTPALENLLCGNNLITSLDPSLCPNLILLSCGGNPITSLDVSSNPALVTLSIEYSPTLTSLDCSGLTALVNIYARRNDNLETIDLRGVSFADMCVIAEGDGAVGFMRTSSADPCVYAYAKDGAVFEGWYDQMGTLVAASTYWYYGTYNYDLLYAVFGAEEHTVTFVDGLTGETVSTVTVEHGSSVTPPAIPEHEGYYSSGWEIDGYPADLTNVTSDMTVTAEYYVIVFEIEFIDGLTGETIDILSVNYGDSLTPPAPPEHEGYHFVGWDEELDCITEELTVYADYEINTYLVEFYGYEDAYLGHVYVNHGSAASAPEPPEVTGYHFVEWDTDISCVTGDLVVTAIYEINTYLVEFYGFDGEFLCEVEVEYGSAAPAPEPPEVTGYHFVEWDEDISFIWIDMCVNAVYEINTYTVTFLDWDGTEISTQEVEHGSAATAPADPEREGYTFTGWDVDFTNVTGDLTVTAQYEQNAPSEYLKGDVNCDGLVDSADITLAAAYAMSAGSVSEQGIANGDMNGDGVLTAADLSALYSFIQG